MKEDKNAEFIIFLKKKFPNMGPPPYKGYSSITQGLQILKEKKISKNIKIISEFL